MSKAQIVFEAPFLSWSGYGDHARDLVRAFLKTDKFDIKIVAGSTMPVNRWAYLEELKQLMNLGVVDDIAVLAETDIKNKEKIVKRKSLYSQLQNQIASLEEQLKKEKGSNETLERQVIQAGIKNKVMQGDVELSKLLHDSKSNILKEELETKAQQKHLRKVIDSENKMAKEKVNNKIKDLQKN